MTILRLLTALTLALALAGCGLLPEETDETKGWSAQKPYSEASAALSSGDYTNAIKYYEKLEARYPFGRYAIQAQLDVATPTTAPRSLPRRSQPRTGSSSSTRTAPRRRTPTI